MNSLGFDVADTPRKKMRVIKLFRSRLSHQNRVSRDSHEPSSSKLATIEAIRRSLTGHVETAFKELGLDIEDDGDWVEAVAWLSWAIFSERGPGAPKKWSDSKLQKLSVAVQQTRAQGARTEADACKLLSKGGGSTSRYKGKPASTLRRVLQNAKRLGTIANKLPSSNTSDPNYPLVSQVDSIGSDTTQKDLVVPECQRPLSQPSSGDESSEK